MLLKTILPNGQVKDQCDVQIEEVTNVLPMFVQIAVGFENGWYVQTTDILEETYLSRPIVEGLETKEQAMRVAQNVSDITGMSIQERN